MPLYCDRGKTLRELRYNAGIDAVLERLSYWETRGLTVIDTSRMADADLDSKYIPATAPAVMKRYAVRPVFGTRRYSGFNFGKGVPALVIQSASGTAEDVFPHIESGRIVTVHDALASFGGE